VIIVQRNAVAGVVGRGGTPDEHRLRKHLLKAGAFNIVHATAPGNTGDA